MHRSGILRAPSRAPHNISDHNVSNHRSFVPADRDGQHLDPADALQIMDEGADLIAWVVQPLGIQTGLGNLSIYEPERPPYTAEDLKSKALSDIFVTMRRWKNFVADEEAHDIDVVIGHKPKQVQKIVKVNPWL